MHALFFVEGGEVKHSDESVLPVTKKEGKGKGKQTIGHKLWLQAVCEHKKV